LVHCRNVGLFPDCPAAGRRLYEISRRLEAGQSSTFFVSLAGGRRNSVELAKLGLLLGVIGFAWERISTMLFAFLAPNIPPICSHCWPRSTCPRTTATCC
jgi:hypothetical protein